MFTRTVREWRRMQTLAWGTFANGNSAKTTRTTRIPTTTTQQFLLLGEHSFADIPYHRDATVHMLWTDYIQLLRSSSLYDLAYRSPCALGPLKPCCDWFSLGSNRLNWRALTSTRAVALRHCTHKDLTYAVRKQGFCVFSQPHTWFDGNFYKNLYKIVLFRKGLISLPLLT